MQHFSIQRLTHLTIFLCLISYILFIGKSILQPLAFAILFMMVSLPIVRFYEKKLPAIPAIFLTFLSILLPLILIFVGLSQYFIGVVENLPSISDSIEKGVGELCAVLSDKIGLSQAELETQVDENTSSLIAAPVNIIKNGISFSTALLANTFLGILGTLNSVGLLIIGVDYAIFWGFLAALLAVVPYVGTFIGGMLPFLYTLSTTGTFWEPMAVFILFVVIQAVEGNLITPKIVGSSVELNPLAAILSLVLGNALWGIGGMILAIPLMAILRVVFTHIEPLRPLGLLLSSQLYDKEEVFGEKFDKKRFRLVNFLKKSQV